MAKRETRTPRKRKPRDYRSEYRKRLARGKEKGLTRAEARGHGRNPPTAIDRADPREKALRLMMEKGESLTKAARTHHIAPERLRQYLRRNTEAQFVGRKWRIEDRRPRSVLIASDGRVFAIDADAKAKSAVGVWWNDVARFLNTNRRADLAILRGRTVRDVHGKTHWLEDRPNVLRRLRAVDELSFLTIYADTPAGEGAHG